MNSEKVISYYIGYEEEKRASATRSEQSEFIYTKKLLDRYIKPSMSVLELGCATGYYGLYLADKCKSYHGVDLSEKHIGIFQEKINKLGLKNVSASLGDATNLSDIPGGSFDVVMVFGPMYHLPQGERQKVILESKRIAKEGGLIFFAYINKIGGYLSACFAKAFKPRYPNKQTNEFVFIKGTDDINTDVFFFTMPEEIECDVTAAGLTVIENAGVHFAFNADDVNAMNEEQYAAWTEITDFMFKSRSCTGTSSNAVLICKK